MAGAGLDPFGAPDPSRPSNPRRERDMAWLAMLYARPRQMAPVLASATPAPQLAQAMDEFNRGDFFACHETLEAAWQATDYPVRLFYLGLIKAAVGYLHLLRGNRSGAIKLLDDAVLFLEPFEPVFLGVSVAQVRADAALWRAWAAEHDPLPPVELTALPKLRAAPPQPS